MVRKMVRKIKQGFTMVELVIIISIIAILIAVVIPTFASVINNAKMVSRYSKASNARNEYFYENKAELDTWSDMQGYLIYVDSQTVYRVTDNGDLVVVDIDIEEGLNDGDYIELSRVYTSDDTIKMYKPSDDSPYSRAIRARNTFRRDNEIDRSYYEMNNYIIVVSGESLSTDVYYQVKYVGEESLNNGMLVSIDKDFSALALEGYEFVKVTEGEDKYAGIIYSPTETSRIKYRLGQVESEVDAVSHVDENIKNGDYIYSIDGNLYRKTESGVFAQVNAQQKSSSGVMLMAYETLIENDDLAEQGYRSIYTSVVSDAIMDTITDQNKDLSAYHTVECYAICFGYYDTNDTYHTWSEVKTIYNTALPITSLEYVSELSESDFSDIKKLIISDTVTNIGYSAFLKYPDLVSVIIPETVTNIEANPFTNGLVSEVVVHKKNTVYSDYNKIGVVIPYSNTYQLVYGTAGLLDSNNKLPNDIALLKAYCFENTSITVIDIEGKTIEEGVFKDCSLLTEVIHTIGTEIPDEMFSGCISLETFEIPSSLETIGQESFKNCTAISYLTLPSTMTNIGEDAFYGTTMTLYYLDTRLTFENIEIEADLTNLTIVYKLKDIIYNLGDGSVDEETPNPTKFDPELDETLVLYIPRISNRYVFEKWTVMGTYSGEYYSNIVSSGSLLNPYVFNTSDYTEDVTLTAIYEYAPRAFNIYYQVDDVDRTEDLLSGDEQEFSYTGTFEDSYNSAFTENITVPLLTKTGYDFDGWYVGGILLDGDGQLLDQYGRENEVTLTSSFTPTVYTITYNLNGGSLSSSNPTIYTIETETFTLNNPTLTDYDFLGWVVDINDDPVVSMTIPQGSTGNITFNAMYSATVYNISYELNGGTVASNITTFTILGGNITLNAPTKRGYTFIGFNDGFENINLTFVCGNYHTNVMLTALFTVNTYSITYTGNHIAENTNPDNYTYGTIINLVAPSVDNGYQFNYWSEANDYVTNNVLSNAVDDITITANITPISYVITYNLNGGELEIANPSSYTIESVVTLVNPTKTGYNFVGWTGTNGSSPALAINIPAGNTGAKTYTANYSLINYTISYTLNGGDVTSNPISYTYEDAEFTLNNPTKAGYDFVGWTGTDLNERTLSVVIANHSTGNRSYVANYNVIGYSITYYLNGGELEIANPETYNVISGTFTLNNPTKAGYDFVGWTGTGLDSASTSVTINVGATGDRVYTANWAIINYTLTYNLSSGTLAEENPTTYTILSEDITLNNPSRDGYTFSGWTGTGLAGTMLEVTISQGSTGNRSYTAVFATIPYTITYLNITGATVSNVGSYNIESNVIVINNPTKNGYTFDGWSGTDITGTSTEVSIPRGSMGDRTFTAHFTAIIYTITYNLGGGSATNPTTYTVESNTINIVNPTKDSYSFAGWSGTGIDGRTTSLSITAGSTGDRTYTANYQTLTYTISYTLNGGSVTGNPTSYNVETATFTLNNPTKNGYTFTGWSGTGIDGTSTEVIVSQGASGNRSYTANYSAVVYTLTYDLAGGSVTSNPTTYTVETATFTLNNPSKTGYTFSGWSGTNVNGIKSTVTIDLHSTGNRSYTAHFTAITYTITYNLGGGSANNPTSYTIESSDIHITNPTKTGSDFTGWGGTDIIGISTDVTIASGSIGDRTYTANYAFTLYTITYTLNGGSAVNNENYTMDSPTFTLNNPTRTAYDFTGWTGSNGNNPNTSVTIAHGTLGNLSFIANWTPTTYTISYNYAGGTAGANVPSSYNVESATFGISDPTRTGYNFSGWLGSLTGTSVSVPTGTYGNLSLTATWTAKTYTITINPNGVCKEFDARYIFFTADSAQSTSDIGVINATVTKDMIGMSTYAVGYNSGYYGNEVLKTTESAYSSDFWQIDLGSSSTIRGAYITPANFTVKTSVVSGQSNNGAVPSASDLKTLTLYCGKYYYFPSSYTVTATYDQSLPSIGTHFLPGYTLSGFYYNDGTNNIQYYSNTGSSVRNWNIDSAVTLTAVYTANVTTVTLDNNTGTGGTNSVSVTFNQNMPTATAPTKTGYTFNGYYSAITGGTQYYTDTMASARVWDLPEQTILYAHWTARTFTITFDMQGGSGGTSSITATYDQTVPNISIPTRSWYSFGGCYTETGGGGTQYYSESGEGQVTFTLTEDITLYAKWTALYNWTKGCTNGYYVSNPASGGAYSPDRYPIRHTVTWNCSACTSTYTAIFINFALYGGTTWIDWSNESLGSGFPIYNYVLVNGENIVQYFGINYPPFRKQQCVNGRSICSGTYYVYHTAVSIMNMESNTSPYSFTTYAHGSGSWTLGGMGA